MAAVWQKEISEYFAKHVIFFTNVTYWLKRVPDPVTKTEHKQEKTNFFTFFSESPPQAQDNKLLAQVHGGGFQHRDKARGRGRTVWPANLQTLNP